MRPIRARTRRDRRRRRQLRVRQKVSGRANRPRLVVFRSLKHMYAQLVDDDRAQTLVGISDCSKDCVADTPGKVGAARAVGKLLAQRAKERGISRVVFDRGGYAYHGRVQAVAEGARENGLEF